MVVPDPAAPTAPEATLARAMPASPAGPPTGRGLIHTVSRPPDQFGGRTAPAGGSGHTCWRGTHTVTLVGKLYPVAIAVGALGTPFVNVTRMIRPRLLP